MPYTTVTQDSVQVKNKQTGAIYTLQKGNSYSTDTYDTVGGASSPVPAPVQQPYSGNVAGVPIRNVDVNAAGGYINTLRNQVKNGSIDTAAAKSQLQKYLLQQFADDASGNFSNPANYTAYQQALSGGTVALFSDLGTIKSPSGQFGEVDLNGNFRTTSTAVNKTTASVSGGQSSTTKNTLPVDIAGNLGPGSSGSDVTKLQEWLKTLGFFPAGQASTGYYGDVTKQAVAAWQQSVGINAGADAGYFGPKSKAYLQQYSIQQNVGDEDTSLFNSEGYKSLTTDQQSVVKSIFDAVSTNDEDSKAKLEQALTKAKEYADPYFKAQVVVALDTLTRGFASEDADLSYNERSLNQKLSDLRELTSTAKDFLSLEQQADIKQLEQEYATQLENTQNDLASAGFGDSSKRTKTENLLTTTKGDMVESTNRSFAQRVKSLDTTLNTSTRDTSQEIERLRAISADKKTELGRKVEGYVGSKNLPTTQGYNPLGGVTGSAEQNYYQDIINATQKFVF